MKYPPLIETCKKCLGCQRLDGDERNERIRFNR